MSASLRPLSRWPPAWAAVAAAAISGAATFTAAIARGNLVATQFHPEKSQKLGLALIANFLKWKP